MNSYKKACIMGIFLGLVMCGSANAWRGGGYYGGFHGDAAYGYRGDAYHYGGAYYGGRIIGGVDAYYDPVCTMVDQCSPNLICGLQEVCQ